ncbi:MAG: hypothetical protein SF162_15385 [bacterium]|nr:hypothetical protein [bacterium]
MTYIRNQAWYIPDKLIFAAAGGEGQPELLVAFLNDLNAMVESSPLPFVHIILDYQYLTKSLTLAQIAKVSSQFKPHERAGWAILINEPTSLLRMFTGVALQWMRVRQRSLPTLEAAEQFLATVDELDWSQADPQAVTRVLHDVKSRLDALHSVTHEG